MDKSYRIYDIDWDTSSWNEECELVSGVCVPDLPEEIEDIMFDFEPDYADIEDWLEKRFGFPVNGFDFEEIP